jgi:hypothetical protein
VHYDTFCLIFFSSSFVSVSTKKGENCDALYAVLNGRLRESVAVPDGHHNRRVFIGTPQQECVGPYLNTAATSFLSRARIRLQTRVMEKMNMNNKNKPKAASRNQPPPPSRRMMNATGEELQVEDFGRGAILGEVEVLTGAW